jgi:hypothetical protein
VGETGYAETWNADSTFNTTLGRGAISFVVMPPLNGDGGTPTSPFDPPNDGPTEGGDPTTGYTITNLVPQTGETNATFGYLTINGTSGDAKGVISGTTVTIVAHPDWNMGVEVVPSVSGVTPAIVPFLVGKNTWKFTMPAHSISVTATFGNNGIDYGTQYEN